MEDESTVTQFVFINRVCWKSHFFFTLIGDRQKIKQYLEEKFGDDSLGVGGQLLSQVVDLNVWDPVVFNDRLLTLFLGMKMKAQLRFVIRDDKAAYNRAHDVWKRQAPQKVCLSCRIWGLQRYSLCLSGFTLQ